MSPGAQSIVASVQQWLVVSIAAGLPVMWALVLTLHFGRAYVLRRAEAGASRLSSDVSWLLYVLARDGAMVATFALATVLIFPNVFLSQFVDLPIGAPLSWLLLLWALLSKSSGDADGDVRRFRVVSVLLVFGAALTIVPEALGVQAVKASYYWDVAGGMGWIAPRMIAALDPDLAAAILTASLVGFAVTSVAAFVWLVGRAERRLGEDGRGATPPAGGGLS